MSKIKINEKEYHYDKKNPCYFLESIGNDFYDEYENDFEDLIVNDNEVESIKVKTYRGTVNLGISDEYVVIWNNVLKKIRGINTSENKPQVEEDEVVVVKTQSQGLRENKNQHVNKSKTSTKQEKRIKIVATRVLDALKEKYPDKEFVWESTYRLKPLLNSLKEIYTDYPFYDKLKDKTSIRPDGGFIYWIVNDKRHILLISEQKQQGTNDERIMEGLKSQPKGNTIERVASPYVATMMMFAHEDINPYIVWCQGCDFHPDSIIFDRGVRTFALQKPNQINLYKKSIGDIRIGGSIYMDGNDENDSNRFEWDDDFMFETMFEIADESFKYYSNKYGE